MVPRMVMVPVTSYVTQYVQEVEQVPLFTSTPFDALLHILYAHAQRVCRGLCPDLHVSSAARRFANFVLTLPFFDVTEDHQGATHYHGREDDSGEFAFVPKRLSLGCPSFLAPDCEVWSWTSFLMLDGLVLLQVPRQIMEPKTVTVQRPKVRLDASDCRCARKWCDFIGLA